MKILILVLSYDDRGVFTTFMKTQMETWDNDEHDDIDVVYYHGGNEDRWRGWGELELNCSDDYDMMHWKFKLALDAIDYHTYDFIFRTNSCSYIVKERLLKVAETLPKTKCYAGWNCGTWISGAGIFFTPDVLDILVNELIPEPYGAEDVMYGRMLAGRIEMIDDKSRIDADVEGFHSFDGYHFRAKTSNDINDRWRDIESLKRLHKELTK
ncbi:MAG: hypothetical protein P4L31_07400 [Candidatus Babeliales bacterium]|nr:hypothetical protein [Candidatus Babeliales bacterium]